MLPIREVTLDDQLPEVKVNEEDKRADEVTSEPDLVTVNVTMRSVAGAESDETVKNLEAFRKSYEQKKDSMNEDRGVGVYQTEEMMFDDITRKRSVAKQKHELLDYSSHSPCGE